MLPACEWCDAGSFKLRKTNVSLELCDTATPNGKLGKYSFNLYGKTAALGTVVKDSQDRAKGKLN